MEKYKEIERSIIKTYRKEIWAKFVKALKEYDLLKENDNVMVCISGGKDSFLLAKLFQELKRHSDFNFEVHYVTMNPGYNDINFKKVVDNAKLLNIPLEVFDSDIFEIVKRQTEGSPCYLCARMRRGALYNHAKEIGCNKIALAHHFNDVIETSLLSMFYGSEIKTMVPKVHSENYHGIELIRPMYLIHEDNIINWKNYNNLSFINCACPLLENCDINDNNSSKRKMMKNLIKELKIDNPNIDKNIFKSLSNINMSCILGYKDFSGKHHDFVDYYDEDLKK